MVDAPAGQLRITGLRHGFETGRTLIDLPDVKIAAGQSLGLKGPSGCGKTSLLHLLAGIDCPVAGEISWGPVALTQLDEAERDRWRREAVGMIFQDFHLIGALSALENVLLPWRFDHWRLPIGATAAARNLLDRVGLTKIDAPVARLSRGERQRVAVARALVRRPAIVLADEPTASLDRDNGLAAVGLLAAATRAAGATLIVASHDAVALAAMDQVIDLGAAP